MEKVIVFKNDTVINYLCGCSKSRLEAPEYYEKHCSDHHNFIECDEWSKTCLCGKQEN